jgi:hypothetical protein
MTKVPDYRVQETGPADESQMRAYWAQWDLMMRGQPDFIDTPYK